MMKTYKTEREAVKDALTQLSEENPCIYVIKADKKFKIIPVSEYNDETIVSFISETEYKKIG